MPDQLILYKLRHSISLKRQPRHGADLEELNGLLSTLKLLHPYELEEPHYEDFQKKTAYAVGGRGLLATCPDGEFLFRLSSVRSVTDNVGGLLLGGISKMDSDEKLWTAFNDGKVSDYKWKPH